MDEKVLAKADEILLKALNGVEKGGEFVIDQAPEVIEQLLVWNFTYSLFSFLSLVLGSLIIASVGGFFIRKVYLYDKGGGDYFLTASSAVVTVLLFLLTFLAAFSSLTWLKILIAPKLYLIEYAAKLVG